VRRGHLIRQLRNTPMPLKTMTLDEFLRYHGLRKKQANPYYKNYKLMKVGY
jgi:hypothetical protein